MTKRVKYLIILDLILLAVFIFLLLFPNSTAGL